MCVTKYFNTSGKIKNKYQPWHLKQREQILHGREKFQFFQIKINPVDYSTRKKRKSKKKKTFPQLQKINSFLFKNYFALSPVVSIFVQYLATVQTVSPSKHLNIPEKCKQQLLIKFNVSIRNYSPNQTRLKMR